MRLPNTAIVAPDAPCLLGFTAAADDIGLPDGVGLWLLSTPDIRALSCAATPQRAEFLKLAQSCHDRLPTYLPLRGRLPGAADMQRYLALNGTLARERIHQTAGCFEAILTLKTPELDDLPNSPGQSGRDWLRTRASAWACQEERRDQTLEAARFLVRDLAHLLIDHRISTYSFGVDVAVLVRKTRIADLPVAAKVAFEAATPPSGTTCGLTGPWPPFSFAGLPPLLEEDPQ